MTEERRERRREQKNRWRKINREHYLAQQRQHQRQYHWRKKLAKIRRQLVSIRAKIDMVLRGLGSTT